MTVNEKNALRSCLEKTSNGLISELVETIGDEQTIVFLKRFGGSTLYIPKLDSIRRSDRDNQIITDYNAGMTYRNLATKYGISERTVRDIVKTK